MLVFQQFAGFSPCTKDEVILGVVVYGLMMAAGLAWIIFVSKLILKPATKNEDKAKLKQVSTWLVLAIPGIVLATVGFWIFFIGDSNVLGLISQGCLSK